MFNKFLDIPPGERSTSSDDRQIVATNLSGMPYYPHEGIQPQRQSTSNGRRYPDDSSDDNRSHRGQGYPDERGRPPEEGRYPSRDRRPPR